MSVNPHFISVVFVLCVVVAAPGCDEASDASEICEGDDCPPIGPTGPRGPAGPPGPALYINPDTGIEYSLNASPCGFTAPFTGNVGGYSSAKGLCEDVNSCSPAAHVCTGDELLRYASTGGSVVIEGRYATGTFEQSIFTNSIQRTTDCDGFTSNDSSILTGMWTDLGPRSRSCNQLLPILCCE